MSTLRVVLDRKEGKLAVLVDDDGGAYDVPLTDLPRDCRTEGAVLDVPMDASTPRWREARRNRKEEQTRLRDAADRLRRLKDADPGGDVNL